MSKTTKFSCRISILLVTYNHENHIRQALDGLFGQVIEGPIELIVADDASSDSTADIIEEYQGNDDRFNFKYLDNTKNVGISKNYQRGFAACTGEYIGILEGDDYWVSPFKLQRQMNFLEDHWECNLCAVNYFIFEESRFHFYPRAPVGKGYLLLGARDLIADNLVGNFSTCMYRKSALDDLPKELFELCSYDWIVNICVAQKSMIGYLNEPMSVYRLHSNGVWSKKTDLKKMKTELKLIPSYATLTNNIYHLEFESLSNQLERRINLFNLGLIAGSISQPGVTLFARLVDYLPPVLLVVAGYLTPPKLKRLIKIILLRGGG